MAARQAEVDYWFWYMPAPARLFITLNAGKPVWLVMPFQKNPQPGPTDLLMVTERPLLRMDEDTRLEQPLHRRN